MPVGALRLLFAVGVEKGGKKTRGVQRVAAVLGRKGNLGHESGVETSKRGLGGGGKIQKRSLAQVFL